MPSLALCVNICAYLCMNVCLCVFIHSCTTVCAVHICYLCVCLCVCLIPLHKQRLPHTHIALSFEWAKATVELIGGERGEERIGGKGERAGDAGVEWEERREDAGVAWE